MSMLKYVLALFVLIVVSVASVCADEGYIPFFPDFLEPDGIGFRGPASIIGGSCWTSHSDCVSHKPGMPFSAGTSVVRSSPITIEYRKNYFFEKLFYLQSLFDYGSVIGNSDISSDTEKEGNRTHYTASILFSDPIMGKYITAEEKKILSSLDSTRIVDLKTELNYILFGYGVGLDLWLLELSFAPFLMYHQTKASLRSCIYQRYSDQLKSVTDVSRCKFNPDEIVDVSNQKYSGFAFGTMVTNSLVFLQTDNLRISMELSAKTIHFIYDSSFKEVQYKGLKYRPIVVTNSGLDCGGNTYVTYDENGENRKPYTDDCINVNGEDMSRSADYTYGLQITYYFR